MAYVDALNYLGAQSRWLRLPPSIVDPVTGLRAVLRGDHDPPLRSANDILLYAGHHLVALPFERILLVPMDADFRPFGIRNLGEGGHGAVVCDKQDLVRTLAFTGASMAVVLHNHPGGVAVASEGDDQLTDQIRVLCEATAVALMDHLVVDSSGVRKQCWSYRRKRPHLLSELGEVEAGQVTYE